jgi:hypothetical protein
MKQLLFFIYLLTGSHAFAQVTQNIFIITTDGYRWQELFNGADSAILFNPAYVKDTATMGGMYWSDDPEIRRKLLMPFTWNYIASKGQLWGNRNYGNEVSVSNPYRFSYAGYNEILTGYADPSIIANAPRKNPNENILSYLNTILGFENKVEAFGSWKLFSYIIKGMKEKGRLNAGYQAVEGDSLSLIETAVNEIQAFSESRHLPTRSDLLTFTLATERIQKKHPRVVFIGFGETDEFAHRGQYDKYLQQANTFDKLIADLWAMIQQDDFYRNKTTLLITTDHGRGRKPGQWKVHGPLTGGSQETWLMQLGPNILPLGEVKQKAAISSDELAQTVAHYLGVVFNAAHPVSSLSYLLTAKTE